MRAWTRALRKLARTGGVSAAVIVVLAGVPAAAQQGDPIRLDEVTVTANKRLQRLADVDGTVSVRSGEDLRRARVTSVQELEKVFPGLVIRTRGNRAYANVTVRGVTSPDFYNPAVQVYVDGVPQDPAYFTQELVNVERVELLRGPQGTLYGRNAHGGVINIITRKPDDKLAASIGGTAAYPQFGVDARLAGPIVPGMLFGDVQFRWDKYLGQVKDVATGHFDIDHSRTLLGKARLRYAPKGDPLDVTLSVQREDLRSHEELYLRESVIRDRQFNSATQGGLPLLDRRVDTVSLAASYDFGKARLSSVTSLQDRAMTRVLQGRDTPENQRSVAEELRLAFDVGTWLSGVAGGYFQDTGFTRRDPGFAGFFGPSRNRVETQSYALFGEATFHASDTFDITAGLRWSREDASINYARVAPAGFAFNAKDSFSDISPKLALGWQVASGHRLYAVVSHGFKPGGFNHTVSNPADQIPYKSERSTNFEVGWRGALFDKRLSLGIAAYWIRATDKQIYVGPLGAQVLRNVGDSDSRGIDVDLQFNATDALTITAGATFGHSTFRNAVDPATGARYDGNRLPYAPDVTAQLAVRYVVPQTMIPGQLSLRAATTFYSRTYFNETNSLSQAPYALLDASVDVVLDNGLTLSLFADNITNKLYRTSSFSFGPGDVRSTIGRGLVVGVTGRMTF